MFEPREPSFEDRIAQKVVARLLPYLQSGKSNGKQPLPKRLLTVKEAASYLGRPSPSAVYKLVSRHEIPVVRHGRNVRFDVRELNKWIESDKG